jgi:(E)-4-hydroxy-3-methylbut-2-enyl-diphosphate synthase
MNLLSLTLLPFHQAPFEEKHRHYFDFQRRSGQLPVQKEVRIKSSVEKLNYIYTLYTDSKRYSTSYFLWHCCLHLFKELSFLIQGEEVDYRGTLHRDGSVLMSVSLDQLKVTF